MKKFKFNKILIIVFAVAFVFSFTGVIVAHAATISLGTANTYGVLSSTFTNTTATTTISGDVGYTTPPAMIPAITGGGHTYIGGGVGDTQYQQAGTDQGTALSSLASAPCTFTFPDGAVDLATETTHGTIGVYTPGVYCTTATSAASIGTAGITLSGAGTYIFRINGALTMVVNSHVSVTNGASECNVFWTPTGATTLGDNSTFIGTDIDAAGITVGHSTSWTGQALAFGGTVTTDTDAITVPTSCGAISNPPLPVAPILTLIKIINGGSLVLADFPLTATGSNTITGVSGTSNVTNASAIAGSYTLTEPTQPNYIAGLWSCNSGVLVGNILTLSNGNNATCTIINTYTAPTISGTTSGGSLSTYGCKDPNATNYNYFSSSDPALCIYAMTASIKILTLPIPTTTTPGLPVTGAGSNAFVNIILLLSSTIVVFFGSIYLVRKYKNT